MAWTVTAGAVTTGTDTSMETAAPSGVTSGDLLVLVAMVETAVTISTPTGWTSRATGANGNSSVRLRVLERIADGGADDTPTVTAGGGVGNWQTVILRIQGQKVTSPFDTSPAVNTNNTGTTPTLPTLNTAEAAELLIAAVITPAANVTGNPSGYGSPVVQSEPVASTMVVYTREVGAAGSYGGETVTLEVSSASVLALLAYKVEIVNSVPVITSDGGGASATLYVNEGTTTVTTVAANGTPTPTFSKSGDDTADFAIDANTGVLTFSPAPDYDSPTDADTNSVYLVTVTATNSEGSDSQDLTVVVNPMYTGVTPDAPLDDAKYFYRFLADHVAGNTQYANHGTRDEPLVLGLSYATEGVDPDWAADGTIGNHLVLVQTVGSESFVRASCPAAVLDTDFTLAIRVRMNTINDLQNLFNVMAANEIDKTIFLHIQADNTIEGRVWDGTTNSQVEVLSTTELTTSATFNLVLTWEGATKTIRLYINGVQEDSNISTNARRTRGTAGYLYWPLDVTINPLACKLFRCLFTDRKWSDAEVLALETSWAWTTDAATDPGAGGGDSEQTLINAAGLPQGAVDIGQSVIHAAGLPL